MNTENRRIELYGQIIVLDKNKFESNSIRIAFEAIATDWYEKINRSFHEYFSDLDDIYTNGNDLADVVRSESIERGMKFLSAHGIYDITEQQFYEKFMSSYDSWDEEFDVVASQYEAIVESTAELDAYRTARRQNRRQWVGYGSRESVNYADGQNLASNIQHGAFNLIAKGFTAIGNAIKKDEIFNSQETLDSVAMGLVNIVMAAFHATVDAVNSFSENKDTLYDYSAEEKSKSEAIVENVLKGRIPKDNILPSLIKAIEYYPYNRDVYLLLLNHFGGDNSHLDSAVSLFGVENLLSEKKKIFDAQRSQVELTSLAGCKANLSGLEEYAKYICYEDFEEESKSVLQAAIRREFDNKLNETDLRTVASCKANIPSLRNFANEIGYQGSAKDFLERINQAVDSDFNIEVSKYRLDTLENCNSNFPQLESYAKEIGYKNFEGWSTQTRNRVLNNASIAIGKAQAQKTSSAKPKVILGLVAITLLGLGWNYYVNSNKVNKNIEEVTLNLNKTLAEQAKREAAQRPSNAEANVQPSSASSADADYELGVRYASGNDLPQDFNQAIALFQKSAEQGYAPAQNSMGVMYQNGQGVPQDFNAAVSWYRQSADQGNDKAQSNLGAMYEEGLGVPHDNNQALEWYKKSADQGNVVAKERLNELLRVRTGAAGR